MTYNGEFGIILAFCLYLLLMMAIGIYYSRRQKNLSQYILGDRQLGPWLTSMSAEASDMSGWMLMGLPGFAYLNGLSAIWTSIGLIAGTWLNWYFISKRLRNYTEVANNSLTIPDYLSNRFEDHKTGSVSSARSALSFSSSFTRRPDLSRPASSSIRSSGCRT